MKVKAWIKELEATDEGLEPQELHPDDDEA
jgi:hypothetical protein